VKKPDILIVDDEPQNLRLLDLQLRPEGYSTRCASSGPEALELVAVSIPDLILLDVMMPGMDGYQVAAKLKGDPATAHIPIIMLTALTDRAARLSGLKSGVEEFLTKPVDLSELLLRLRNLLRLKAYADLLRNHGTVQENLVATRTAELKRFRAAMEISGDVIALVDRASMRYIDVNQTFCDLSRYTREELVGMQPMQIFSASRATLERDYDALISNNEAHAGRTTGEYVRKDGSVVPVESRRRALHTEDGWIIVCTARDITERRISERRLNELAQLRHTEAARQAVILNALPAHVALLDSKGVIVSVNEAWRQFARDNAFVGRDASVGSSYVAACGKPLAGPADEGARAAAGIVDVLEGRAKSFTLEYSCHAPDEQRWFLLTATPLDDDRRDGVVIMHTSTTEQRRSRQELLESERRFTEMLDTVDLASIMLDTEGRITYCNGFFQRLTGWKKEELIGRAWSSLCVPSAEDRTGTEFSAAHHQDEIVTRNGKRRLIRWNNTVLRTPSGEVTGTASIGDDVTESTEAEVRIAYLNRVYAVLSGIDSLIVRVDGREELFREACRIAVEAGGFRMAWIGMVQGASVVPTASAGHDKDLQASLEAHFVSATDADLANSMTLRALKTREAVVCNDTLSDAGLLFGDKHAAAGIRSMVILPLLVAGEVVGVLTLYAEEKEFFNSDELKLLTELAGDISFAIDHIGRQEKLDYLAYYDVLTGLANRRLFLERLGQYMRSAAVDGTGVAVFLVDLERFKNINDSLGQSEGDTLLKLVAEWLIHKTGDASLLSRISADRFAILLPRIDPDGNVERLIEKASEQFLDHAFQLKDAVLRISAKVGVAVFRHEPADADSVLKKAEVALKKAKASGERYVFFTENMAAATAGNLTLENQLRQALEKEEFVLHYQPKINLATGRITSAEALIRWNDPRTGLVPPGRFIPILEETGLIYDVGRWALRKAVQDYLRWKASGLGAVRIAVNVSPLQLRNRAFVAEIAGTVGTDPHAASGLELEITESLIMENVKHSIASLQAIRAMGITIAIDDFGTGFSSLSYLAKLPVNTLKIDRSFVVEMTANADGLSLVSTIINLSHALKLKVVAEGVETEEQSRLLCLLSCDEMQGFLFSKPVPSADFESRFLAALAPPVPAAATAARVQEISTQCFDPGS
jgi:diguanylate cyclase (GGDEF)-like protein/PAS domain S-box-containing protein